MGSTVAWLLIGVCFYSHGQLGTHTLIVSFLTLIPGTAFHVACQTIEYPYRISYVQLFPQKSTYEISPLCVGYIDMDTVSLL